MSNQNRYQNMNYRYCGRSGLQLPELSLGLWHNFGDAADYQHCRQMIQYAFDNGITHFDLANNYGPAPGSAERTFGRVFQEDLLNHRHELVISTKAGYDMWDGPYGNGGSRKYLFNSLDQSLERMGIDHVDIFYSHRYDPNTPLIETMGALADIVKMGKALYVGISNYPPQQTREAYDLLQQWQVPCLIHQVRYSIFAREPEDQLLSTLAELGVGCIAFSPLAQGLLTERYQAGVPADSRMASKQFLKEQARNSANLEAIAALADIAAARNVSLAQLAIMWILRHQQLTSVLIGASRLSQLEDNLAAIGQESLGVDELNKIDNICQIRQLALDQHGYSSLGR